jgi:hypothetical protein
VVADAQAYQQGVETSIWPSAAVVFWAIILGASSGRSSSLSCCG